MDLKESGWEGMDCIDLAQDRKKTLGSCEGSNESSGSIKCREFLNQLRNYWNLKKDSVSYS